MDWLAEQRRLEEVGRQADDLVARLGLTMPVPLDKVIRSERPFLVAGGRDFGHRFDGKLKYSREHRRFVLLFNTKYDDGFQPGGHHPRTRFSIAHELGHYFIPHHHAYLRRGGRSHPSSGEFRTALEMEREADAFAASLLMPTKFMQPEVDKGELTFDRLDAICQKFGTSEVSTAIRSVRLSSDPCALAGIRDGRIAWMFASERLIEAGCYPGKRGLESPFARRRWEALDEGDAERAENDGKARHWFQMYQQEDGLHDVWVTERCIPIPAMDTLLVALALDEDDLFDNSDDEGDEDD